MSDNILCFVKFFDEEKHADEFLSGNALFRKLSYFKQKENSDDGRADKSEGISEIIQPRDAKIKICTPQGDINIDQVDLAGPVTIAYNEHDNFYVFCLYSVFLTPFVGEYSKEILVKKLRDQLVLDERCLRFGRYAVIFNQHLFLGAVKREMAAQGVDIKHGLIEYYDESISIGFDGDAALFKKQNRFSYQKEYRFAFHSAAKEEMKLISFGDISKFAVKADSAAVIDLINFEFKQ